MCTYLAKRGAIYYFRRVIPEDLRPVLGRAEFMISLRTKDREAAKRLIPNHTTETDRAMDDARLRHAQERPAWAVQAVSDRSARLDSQRTQKSFEASEYDEFELGMSDARQEARNDERELWQARLRLSTAEMTPQEAAVKDLLRHKDFDLTLARDELRRLRVQLAGARGVAGYETPAATLPSKESDILGAGTSLNEIADRLAIERKVRAKTADASRSVARWFHQRVGAIPVETITRKHVLAFKNKMLAEGTTATNTNVKLSRLRTLLQYAVENDYLAQNPAKGVSVVDNNLAKNKRTEFDLPALKALFGSPVYTQDDRPAQGRGEAAYWLPLLALYTGARLEEIGQLRPSDVAEQTYPDADDHERTAWFIRITEDEADGLHLKNAASERRVPVHPELERLGLIQFVEAAKRAKRTKLFDTLRPDKYGRLTAKWGEWFSLYRRNVCGVTDKRMTFHSFRHTFKHYARHVSMTEGVQRQIMGHTSGDVADDYGSGYTLHSLVEGMNSYRVVGFSPPSPPPAYRGLAHR